MVPLIFIPLVTLAMLIGAQLIAWLAFISKGFELTAPMANPLGATLEVIATSLWIAPLYAWIMVVSAWARRAVLLLAFLPMVLVSFVEAMLRGPGNIGHALFYRGIGRHWPMKLGLDSVSPGEMIRTPAPELLGSLSLWGGMVLAVLLLAVVVRLRRRMIAVN
jgi:ABC-2 type transport system permease protein